jgi:two-component system, response regulator PdtaR
LNIPRISTQTTLLCLWKSAKFSLTMKFRFRNILRVDVSNVLTSWYTQAAFAGKMARSMLTAQTIMIVEDERITAEDVRLRLESWGYRVPAVVDTGEDAIRAAEQLKPDLMLMDIHLKGTMDGVEAAQRIRQRRDIPVIYATAHLDSPTVKRARVADSFGFINKPYEDREMRSAIELTLLKRQLERRVAEVEERYRKVVGRVSDMVLITRRGKILSANDAAERALGRTAREWSAIVLLDLVDPADRAATGEMLRTVESGASAEPCECRLVHREGTRVYVKLNADRCSHQGEAALLLIITDTTSGARVRRWVDRLGPAWVLVVDDDETARTITRRMLESLGCMVDECATGDEAIAAVRDGQYDLILLDCHIGGRDGHSTAAEIRRCENDGRHIPIVALTADGDEAGRERCRQAGMDGHLTKPVQMNVLDQLLTTLA